MKRGRSSSRRTVAAIIALVVLDLVLVALAFGTTRSRPSADQGTGVPDVRTATQTPSRTSTSSGPSTPTQGSSTTTSPSGPSAPDIVPTTLRLVALGGDVAWQAAQGSCDGGGSAVSVTTDGGRTWSGTSPTRAVLRLLPKSASSASVVGAGSDCSATMYATSSSGRGWSGSGSAADTWYRDPKDASRVHTVSAGVVQPCEGQLPVVEVVSLSADSAQALCADGTLRATTDGGASWKRTASVPGARAMDARQESGAVVAYVLRVDPSCSGLQVARARTPAEGLGCLQGAAVPGSGALALSVNGDNGWVVSGDQTWRSTDGLRSWTKA